MLLELRHAIQHVSLRSIEELVAAMVASGTNPKNTYGALASHARSS